MQHISVKDSDKPLIIETAKILKEIGFTIFSTTSTSIYLNKAGVTTQHINKVREGRPHILDLLQDGKINLVINTSEGIKSFSESSSIRKTALIKKFHTSTTIPGQKP